MSNRSLLEFNHDHWHKIDADPRAFNDALQRYLSSATRETAAGLECFGVRVVGMRHHSDGFGPFAEESRKWRTRLAGRITGGLGSE